MTSTGVEGGGPARSAAELVAGPSAAGPRSRGNVKAATTATTPTAVPNAKNLQERGMPASYECRDAGIGSTIRVGEGHDQ